MRTIFGSLLLIFWIGLLMNPQKATAKGYVSNKVFYKELSPYGTWLAVPNHGYVWKPKVAKGFTPYATNGYWANTDEGWSWVSNYPWGWAPFHYGRWYNDKNHGPLWIPDNEWSPGWVNWRNADGYYVWAPMGPTFSNNYYVPYNRWVYVKGRDFGRGNNKNYYYVNSRYNRMVFHNTKAIKNFRKGQAHNSWYNMGPNKFEVEKYHGKKFKPYTNKQHDMFGQKFSGNQLHPNKPQVKHNNYGKPAPQSHGNNPVQHKSQRTKQNQATQTNKSHQPSTGQSNPHKGGKK